MLYGLVRSLSKDMRLLSKDARLLSKDARLLSKGTPLLSREKGLVIKTNLQTFLLASIAFFIFFRNFAT